MSLWGDMYIQKTVSSRNEDIVSGILRVSPERNACWLIKYILSSGVFLIVLPLSKKSFPTVFGAQITKVTLLFMHFSTPFSRRCDTQTLGYYIFCSLLNLEPLEPCFACSSQPTNIHPMNA